MPTIDELAPANAAGDLDIFPVSQYNITRKITRSQILAGVQAQIVLPGGCLLGRGTAGIGIPEIITIGNYLNLASGTLSAAAAPYSIVGLVSGTIPAGGDLVPLGQGGTNVAISYSVFMQGLSSVANIDGSQLQVRPTGASAGFRISDLVSSMITNAGGSLAGPLFLASNPTTPLQAATKQLVDSKVSRAGDSLSGALQLSGDPVVPLQAATKQYVDSNSGFPRSGFTMGGPIVLVGDPVSALNPSTKSYTDTRLVRAGDTMTGPLILSFDPGAPYQAATKNYVDKSVSMALPLSGGLMTGPLLLSADPANAFQAASKQYTDTKLARAGDTLTGYLTLSADPSNSFHAATKGYVDNQVITALPRSGGTMSGAIVLAGNPTQSAHAVTKYYVDAGLSTVLPIAGGTLIGPVSQLTSPSIPAHLTNKQFVDSQVSGLLPLTGGSLAGALLLNASPTAPMHAVTRQYVDANPGPSGVVNVRLPPCGAKIDGITDDTSSFIAAYQLAPAGGTIYVPNGITVLRTAVTWGVPLTKHVKWVIDGTTLPDGTPLADGIPSGTVVTGFVLPGTVSGTSGTGVAISQSNSQSTDFSVAHTSYSVNHTGGAALSVISNSRSDTIISQSPNNHVWSGIDRLVWNGSQTFSAANPSKHIGRFVQAVRQGFGSGSSGAALPQPLMWSGYLQFIDATGQASSATNSSVAVAMDWVGNGVDDANLRQIQALSIGQYNLSGPPVEVSTAISVSMESGTAGKIYRVFNVTVPFSISVLDTTAATQLSGAAAIRLAAGQAIAFESTNAVNLSYSGSTGAIIAKYGSISCAVGRGLSVSYGIVFATNATIPATSAGSVVFLVGNSPYTITLPAASTVAPGTGYTFSTLGLGLVSIVPGIGDTIDLSPVVLRQYDRYHIVSDGASLWREIFRSNAVSPHFTGPPILPSYLVSTLPAGPGAGAKAFATNGRKPTEASGAGTGVEVFYDGVQWISVCSGLPVSS